MIISKNPLFASVTYRRYAIADTNYACQLKTVVVICGVRYYLEPLRNKYLWRSMIKQKSILGFLGKTGKQNSTSSSTAASTDPESTTPRVFGPAAVYPRGQNKSETVILDVQGLTELHQPRQNTFPNNNTARSFRSCWFDQFQCQRR